MIDYLKVLLIKNIKNKKIKITGVTILFIFSTVAPVVSLSSSEKADAQQAGPSVKEATEINGKEIAGSIIVTKDPDKIVKAAKSKGLKTEFVEESSKNKPSIVAVGELPEDERVKDLEKRADVENVAPNYVYRTKFTPNDPNYSAQWNMPKISAPAAWDITRGNSSVTVAVIDTGVLFSQTINGTTYSQPDFPTSRQWTNPGETSTTQSGDTCWTGTPLSKQSNDCDDDSNGLVDDWRGWDFMGGFRGSSAACPNHNDHSRYEGNDSLITQDSDPQPYSCDSPSSPSVLNKNDYDGSCVAWTSACYVGHGTMVASVASVESNNNQLIAGIDHNGKIMSLRVIDGYGYTTTARIVAAIDYAADNGADVINMSLGMSCNDNNFTDPTMENALADAASAGVVAVAASGNESEVSSICYPASSQYVMGVGATDQNDNRHSYSNYSNKLDIVAPTGVPVANAPSAYINSNYYASAGGTSLATPHAAGLAALIKAQDPSLSRSQVVDYIRKRADKVPGMQGKMFHNQYGYGRINAHISTLVASGKLPVYRLYHSRLGKHFYTASVDERDRANDGHGFRYEGRAFWGRNTTVDTIPVFRLYHKKLGKHFYTTSVNERNRVVESGYLYEGVGFRLLESATKAIYRLHHAPTHNHLYTANAVEKDRSDSNGFDYEGVGFRAE